MTNVLPRYPTHAQETYPLPFAHPGGLAATTTTKIWKTVSTGRPFRFFRVAYDNVTGFAADPSNYWTVQINAGATIIYQWSTQTAQQGTLTADTWVEFVKNATDANLVVAPGTVLTLVITKTGAPGTFPAGSGVIEGRYI